MAARWPATARAAGVERVTAHSGRVGLASELTSRGASTTYVMLAGNWKTSRMVRTTRRERPPNAGLWRGTLQAAAVAAGVEHRLTGHSGRVGLASELTARGASTADVMLAGGWKTARMVAHYAAGATAERGAVARFL